MKKMMVALLLVMAMSPLFAGGQNDEDASGDNTERLVVVATTSIIHDVVQQIAGDRADVKVLMGYGQNPHAFEPAPRDMAAIEKADIVFVNGYDLEENLMRSIRTLEVHHLVEVSAGGEHEGHEAEHHEEHDTEHHEHEADHDDHEGEHHEHEADRDEHEAEHHDDHEGEHHEHEADHDEHEGEHHDHEAGHDHHHHGGADPHTWMSPLNVMEWTERIAHALGEEDPTNAEYYEKRANEYKAELKKLDHKIREALAPIPEERRIIVTDHDLFGYFARDYHVTVVGTIIPSFSTNAEPSAKDMAELLEKLKERGVNALFVGETSGEAVIKLARSLEKESGGKAEVVSFLTGSLRKKGEKGDSYISYMEYNLKQIVYGLQL